MDSVDSSFSTRISYQYPPSRQIREEMGGKIGVGSEK